jgi:hypothetical protein
MIELKDNVLDDTQFTELQIGLTSGIFPWAYTKDTALSCSEMIENNFSFNNTLYDIERSHNAYGLFYNLCLQALNSSLSSIGYELLELHRIRVNLYTRNHETMIHHPHIDDDNRDSKVGILYITTNYDSPTLLYNEVFDPQVDINDINSIEGRTFTIRDVVHSVENRFVLFNGNRYHSSTRPTKEDIRVNINYNFTTK